MKYIVPAVGWVLIVFCIAYAPVRDFVVQAAFSVALDALIYLPVPIFIIWVTVLLWRKRK